MFSFPTATEHSWAASSAFTLSEAATRGILWKKVFLKKLTEVLNWFKINEKMGSSHRGFYMNALFFQDGGYKTSGIVKYFSKVKKWIYLCKTCYYINFL